MNLRGKWILGNCLREYRRPGQGENQYAAKNLLSHWGLMISIRAANGKLGLPRLNFNLGLVKSCRLTGQKRRCRTVLFELAKEHVR